MRRPVDEIAMYCFGEETGYATCYGLVGAYDPWDIDRCGRLNPESVRAIRLACAYWRGVVKWTYRGK